MEDFRCFWCDIRFVLRIEGFVFIVAAELDGAYCCGMLSACLRTLQDVLIQEAHRQYALIEKPFDRAEKHFLDWVLLYISGVSSSSKV